MIKNDSLNNECLNRAYAISRRRMIIMAYCGFRFHQ